VKYFIESQNRS